MNDLERRLLALVERHLMTWECQTCGAVWLTGKSKSGSLFHRCVPYRRPRFTFDLPDRETDTRRWALNVFGEALETELGDRAYLDTEEE